MRPATASRPLFGGIQHEYRFANGYGASIVRHPYSYGYEEGLWELGVIRLNGPEPFDSYLDYDTPVADGVIGRLAEDEVEALLVQIEALPEAPK